MTGSPEDLASLEDAAPAKEDKGIDELRLILDVYKHHWDAFLRGFGLYLIACSVLVGYGLSQQADIYNKIFSGIAVIVASAFMYFGMNIAISWMNDTAARATAVSTKLHVTTISFSHPIKAVRTLRMTTVAMAVTGILYITYILYLKIGVRLHA